MTKGGAPTHRCDQVGHERQNYHAMVKFADAALGNVTGALKAKGMWDNTLLVFSSDNGGCVPKLGRGGVLTALLAVVLTALLTLALTVVRVVYRLCRSPCCRPCAGRLRAVSWPGCWPCC